MARIGQGHRGHGDGRHGRAEGWQVNMWRESRARQRPDALYARAMALDAIGSIYITISGQHGDGTTEAWVNANTHQADTSTAAGAMRFTMRAMTTRVLFLVPSFAV
jgi:hypothetical protein